MARESVEVTSLLHDIDALPFAKQRELAKRLLVVLSTANGASRILDGEDISEFKEDSVIACPFCGKKHVSKWGYASDKVTRRYKCSDCKRTFRRTTNSVIAHTHKDARAWEEFILLTIKGASLETCAKRCKIAVGTAFSWRHKILAALAQDQSTRVLSGIVEMDETFFRVSYKGNHKNSKTFKMPRPAFKRGSARVMMRDRACVLCAVERGKQAYSEVVCRGAISAKLLEGILPKHLKEDSMVLTDGLYAYASYFNSASQTHKGIKAKTKGKGAYHINNINNYHGRLRGFLRNYNGVSTKYLNSYVALFAWLENARLMAKNNKTVTVEKVLEFGHYHATKEFETWERDPKVALAA